MADCSRADATALWSGSAESNPPDTRGSRFRNNRIAACFPPTNADPSAPVTFPGLYKYTTSKTHTLSGSGAPKLATIKFFAWLLVLGKLNCRSYRYRRNICTVDESYCALCPSVEETDNHIFFECALARNTWECIGVDPDGGSCRHPWLMGRELPLPSSVQYDAILLVFWQLWKARNAMIFNQEQRSPRRVLRHVVEDMDNWISRYKHHSDHWSAWIDYFTASV
ncbi:hypothetical protein HU200_049844 [Digitaria exilis]|uniref:Reverse transcriptase zinc-binding domain-containing protein n=1 Tax=Digitaria exilis TaxID=1010633 RepID=A0A835ASK0_9POAL|nr:hypothetical protein HU200_049844 [Digitaria exilis]